MSTKLESAAPAIPIGLTSALRSAARTGLQPWHGIAATIAYCLRTLAAIGIALYIAFSLQLQSPLSSVITVLIVANPVSGALVSKSLWRLLGTMIGAIAAVTLMACFAQSPMLFYLFFSLWIGVACVASTLLRFFKAYGAVLAGYTIIIVCAPAFADPENVFSSAISRLSAVAVGIAAAALVFLLTRIRPPARLREAMLDLVRSAAAILADHRPGPDGAPPGSLAPGFYDRRSALLAQANGLNEIIEYAAADSPAVARQARRLRLGAAGLVGTLSTLHPLLRWPPSPGCGHNDGHDDDLAAETRSAIASLGALRLEQPGPMLDRLAAVRERLAALLAAEPPAEAVDLDRLAAIERAHDLLSRLHQAVSRLAAPQHRAGSRASTPRLRLFLDWPTALRNGARGFIVTMLACLFWYVSAWPSAPTLLAYLVPASCLLATNPSASRASLDFSIGTLMAIPASYVCESLLLPQIEGFPLLLGALALCLLPGIWLQFHPRLGLRAFGYVVFFNAMITVRNPIEFNDIGLVNSWLAFIVGTAALVVVFRALLPPSPARDADRLAHSLARAVVRAGQARRPPPCEVWDNLQMQKLLRLIQRLQSPGLRHIAPERRHDVTDRALIAIELGRDVLRLRRLLVETGLGPRERQAVDTAMAAIVRLRRDPQHAAATAGHTARLLAGISDPPPGLLRIAALLRQISVLSGSISGFLSHEYTVARC